MNESPSNILLDFSILWVVLVSCDNQRAMKTRKKIFCLKTCSKEFMESFYFCLPRVSIDLFITEYNFFIVSFWNSVVKLMSAHFFHEARVDFSFRLVSLRLKRRFRIFLCVCFFFYCQTDKFKFDFLKYKLTEK